MTHRRPAPAAIAALVLLAAAAAGAPAVRAEVAVPANDGWVTDLAGFLEPQQERSLEALMESYKQGSGNEIALLTLPELGGETIERTALEVARAWGIGEKERHNGALLVVSRAERKLRIEVGRGLEGNLPDSISGRIIRNVISPEFKRGRFYEGLRAGVEAMHQAAGGDYAAIPESRGRKPGSGIAGLIGPVFFLVLLILMLSGGSGRGGGILPWLLLGTMTGRGGRSTGWHSGGFGGGGGGFGGFGGGGGFSGGGASGGW